MESGNWDGILEKRMLQIFSPREDENMGANFIIGQIKTISVKTVLWKLVFVYSGMGKGREIEHQENTNVKMQEKYIENQKQKWAVTTVIFTLLRL